MLCEPSSMYVGVSFSAATSACARTMAADWGV